jgi:hypothetical protein
MAADQPDPALPGTPPGPLLAALRRLLQPLVRLAISRGITYPALSELMKELFVEVANRDFALAGKAQTDSRLTLLTGVHRKDVKRLREEKSRSTEARMPRSVSLGAQVASAWSTRPGYVDADGAPLPLPKAGTDGSEASFESLVASVSKDIRPRAVLDEWIRLGVVSVDDQGRVHLDSAAFVPNSGFEEMSFYLGQNIHDHIAAIDHNLASGAERFLERCVHYDHVAPESLPELARLAELHGMKALRAVNARAGSPQTRGGDWRMNFGIYFFAEPLPGGSQERNNAA